MKLSQYAKQQGISYRSALRWFRVGAIKGHQGLSRAIKGYQGLSSAHWHHRRDRRRAAACAPPPAPRPEKVAIYARVSSAEHKEHLEQRAARLTAYCAARGSLVAQVVKSINQFSTKHKAKLQSRVGHPGTTAQTERLTAHRMRQIDHYLHPASRRLIDLLLVEGIGTLCIGKNPLEKQGVGMGRRNTQNVVSVPHARFIARLTYKAELVGIQVIVTEESSTSTASFLEADPLPVYDAQRQGSPIFSGKRLKRGLYQAADGVGDCMPM